MIEVNKAFDLDRKINWFDIKKTVGLNKKTIDSNTETSGSSAKIIDKKQFTWYK